MTVDDGRFILHGGVLYMESETELFEKEDAYLICDNGVSAGVYDEIPEEFREWPLVEAWENLIVPGFVDLRANALLANFRGLTGLLKGSRSAFEPFVLEEEEKIASDREYAERSFDAFLETAFIGPLTRLVVSGGSDLPAAVLLAGMLDETGLGGYVGYAVCDLGYPPDKGRTPESELKNAERFLRRVRRRRLANTKPCLMYREEKISEALFSGLEALSEKEGVPLLKEERSMGLSGRFLPENEYPDPLAAFYGLTVGAGKRIGCAGNFEPGAAFDALILSDANLDTMRELTLRERLFRVMQLGDDRSVVGKFVEGWKVF
ncbi:MAG: hypothetical protein K6E30_01170 [Lachnospiraceae bacterium]|nr:hypothetical protein [Lachnospiraceae bacterium]